MNALEETMTNRYTQSEWRNIIDEAERDLPSSSALYKAPRLGTPDFARCIDHTLLKFEATKDQIDEICEEARRALELDMVINHPLLKQQRYSEAFTDVAAVRNVAPHPVVLKVILETSKLSQVDIIAGCKVAEAANADFVKTSTGFGGQGATEKNVRLMKSVIGPNMKVKASGGVKTVNECVAMMEAGAERIGTSNGVWIMKEAQSLLENFTHAVADKARENRRPADSLTRMFSSS
ncbi:MAG: hypothetical protein Q9173_005440 [Seirophora scorigena]